MLIDIHNAARAITDSIQSIESITAEGQLIELGILSKVWMDGWMDGWQECADNTPWRTTEPS
jgi:hypothetical protein